jgi:polyisoprenoid-binding protein YceI
MRKSLIITLFSLLFIQAGISQKYFTKEAKVEFLSDAALEKIEAVTKTGTCVLDASSGKVEFAVLIKSFQFEKALMQEHFNENYMESSKYPKAIFKGQMVEWSNIDLAKDGNYQAIAKGQLTMHGETNNVSAPVQITVKNGKLVATSSFSVALADYNIEIPAVVADNIAKNVEIMLEATLQELKR